MARSEISWEGVIERNLETAPKYSYQSKKCGQGPQFHNQRNGWRSGRSPLGCTNRGERHLSSRKNLDNTVYTNMKKRNNCEAAHERMEDRDTLERLQREEYPIRDRTRRSRSNRSWSKAYEMSKRNERKLRKVMGG